MDETTVSVDLTQAAAAIVAVFVEPYNDLLNRLHSEGRVTDAEIEELQSAVRARGDRLGELTREALSQEPG